MNNLTTEFKVGIFTVLGVSILVATAFILGGNPFVRKKQHFYSILNNASGIAKRTQVRTAGVEVGTVSAVEILDRGAKIVFDIDSDVQIPKNSVIEIKSKGMLGDVYIEIDRNLNEKELMVSGEKIPLNAQANDLESLLATMNGIGRDIKKVSATLESVMGSEKGSKSLHNIVSNIEKMTKDLQEITGTGKENLKETIALIHESAQKISELINNNETKVSKIIANIQSFSSELKKLASADNRDKVESILEDLQNSSLTLKHLMSKVEKGEGTVGQLLAKDDTANDIRTTLKDIQHLVQPIADLKISITYNGSYRVNNAKEGDKFTNDFNLKFQTRPNRYYLFGVTTGMYARQVQDTVTTNSKNENGDNVTRVEQNTPENTGSLRYNAQVAQRFDFVTLRFGLFSNSGGIATDFYAFDDKLVGSFEFSQFDGSPTPSDTQYGKKGVFNLKAYANYFITPHIFIGAGVDGLVMYKNPFPFVGAGFTLTDSDFKSLLGVASMGK